MSRILDHVQRLSPSRSASALAACLAATALVAGCGGGDRVKSFQPTQIIAFGDESSAFDDTATDLTHPYVDFRSPMVGNPAPTVNGDVPYRARYTINLVGDVGFLCKDSSPDPTAQAGCDSTKVPPSNLLVQADYPTSTSYFITQSSVYGYRLVSGIIPIVNQVDTGAFNDAPSPAPIIYATTDHTYHCSTDFGADYGNWVQLLAANLGGSGLTVKNGGCPQDLGNGISYAKWGAKVDDVAAQVNAHLGDLHDGVLVTMLAGQNDIMASFDRVQASPSTQDDELKLMRNKGAQLAGIINIIVNTGARVAYLTVPDMAVTPKAVNSGNPTLANLLTHAFNEGYQGNGESKESGGLVLSVINNGHKIVKVDAYTLLETLTATYPSVFACDNNPDTVTMPNGATVTSLLTGMFQSDTTSADYLNAKAKALLLNCRSNNLKVITPPTSTAGEVRAAYTDYLWADELRLSPLGHANLSNLAVSRIRDQL